MGKLLLLLILLSTQLSFAGKAFDRDYKFVTFREGGGCAIVESSVACWSPNKKLRFQYLPVQKPQALVESGDEVCVLDENRIKCFYMFENQMTKYYQDWESRMLVNTKSLALHYGVLAVIENGQVLRWANIPGDKSGDYLRKWTELPAGQWPGTAGVTAYDSNTSFKCALIGQSLRCVRKDKDIFAETLSRLNNVRDFSVGEENGCALNGDELVCFGKGFDWPRPADLQRCRKYGGFPHPRAVYLNRYGDEFCVTHDDGISCIDVGYAQVSNVQNSDCYNSDYAKPNRRWGPNSVALWSVQFLGEPRFSPYLALGDNGLTCFQDSGFDPMCVNRIPEFLQNLDLSSPSDIPPGLRVLAKSVYKFDRDWLLYLAERLDARSEKPKPFLAAGFLLATYFQRFSYPGVRNDFVMKLPGSLKRWAAEQKVESVAQLGRDLELQRFTLEIFMSLLKTSAGFGGDDLKNEIGAVLADLGQVQATPDADFPSSFAAFVSAREGQLTKMAEKVAVTPYIDLRASLILQILEAWKVWVK